MVKQIVNKYLRMYSERNVTIDAPHEQENFEEYFKKVKANGNQLFFRALHVHSYDLFKQIVVCESVKLTNK